LHLTILFFLGIALPPDKDDVEVGADACNAFERLD
jgi:hypothetical protein